MGLVLGNGQRSNLEEAKRILQESETVQPADESNLDLEDYVISTIKANVCSTISIKKEADGVMVVASFPSGIKVTTFPNHDADSYIDFCQHILEIDPNEEYNCSRSLNIDGVKTRVYAVMPPLAFYPIITISTTKTPPSKLDKQTISDEMFDEIVHSNFMIVGSSGSGKSVYRYQVVPIKKRNDNILKESKSIEITPDREKLKEFNLKNDNDKIEYILWEDLQQGDVFPEGEVVTFIANWERRPCYEVIAGDNESVIVSDEHIMQLDVFDQNGNKIENECYLGEELLKGWSNAKQAYEYFREGYTIFSGKDEFYIYVYEDGKEQDVRCIQTDCGHYTINGIMHHNTYLFNYLLNKFIRDDERIGIIEEFMEIIPPNKLCYSMICPPPKPNEKSLLRFMTEQSNLMRLDAIYVGEIKGAEAWPFVVNMASGTRGACTLHGDSPAHALSRLRALCQLETNNAEAINEFIAKSVKYIIHMKQRKINSIVQLTGTFNKNTFAMTEIIK